jgi:hypothetical protein
LFIVYIVIVGKLVIKRDKPSPPSSHYHSKNARQTVFYLVIYEA